VCCRVVEKKGDAGEKKTYISGKTKRLLRNASLYQAFYKFYDDLGFKIIKVKGHTRSTSRDKAHCIFSILDKEGSKEGFQAMDELTRPFFERFNFFDFRPRI
jgi:hypothetical protein